MQNNLVVTTAYALSRGLVGVQAIIYAPVCEMLLLIAYKSGLVDSDNNAVDYFSVSQCEAIKCTLIDRAL